MRRAVFVDLRDTVSSFHCRVVVPITLKRVAMYECNEFNSILQTTIKNYFDINLPEVMYKDISVNYQNNAYTEPNANVLICFSDSIGDKYIEHQIKLVKSYFDKIRS